MRKILGAILALLLALSMGAGAAAEPAADDVELTQKLDAMLPIADSVLRTMGVEGEFAFDPADAEFAWTVLYLTGVNWSFVAEDIKYTDDYVQIVVPAARMREFARALGLDDVPAIPESLAQAAAYDAEQNAYLLEGSDAGDSYTRIDSHELDGDDVIVTVALYGYGESDHEYIGGLKLRLTPDPEPGELFAYRVVGVA